MLVQYGINNELIITNNTDKDYSKCAMIDVPRINFPGKKDVNGNTYTVDSYQKALLSDRFRELMDTGELQCEIMNNQFNNPERTQIIDPTMVCGQIVKITDSMIRVKIKKDNPYYQTIIKLSDENKLYAFMRYLAEPLNEENKLYIIKTIITFDIGPKEGDL